MTHPNPLHETREEIAEALARLCERKKRQYRLEINEIGGSVLHLRYQDGSRLFIEQASPTQSIVAMIDRQFSNMAGGEV